MTITLDGTNGLTTPGVTNTGNDTVSLGVYAKAAFTGTFTDGIVVDYTTGLGRISVGTSDGLAFYNGGVGSTEVARFDASGNFGIGTSSPGAKLQVNSSSAVPVLITGYSVAGNAGAYNGALLLGNTATYQGQISFDATSASYLSLSNTDTAGSIRFAVGGSERARIDSSGNLLVGTTSQGTTEKFSAYQSSASACAARFYASSTSFANDIVQISCATSGASTQYNAMTVFDTTSTLKMLIRANGNLLNVNNSYGSLSDQSIKENIVDATPKLQDLLAVKIRNFNIKGDTTKQIGVIAQEIEEVFPGMIEEGADGLKGVKYSVFVPILVKALQELSAKVTALESK